MTAMDDYITTINYNADGETVRDAVSDALLLLASLSPILPPVTAADEGKRLTVSDTLTWEVSADA